MPRFNEGIKEDFMKRTALTLCLQSHRHQFNSWVGKLCWRRDKLPTLAFFGFPGGSAGEESAFNMGCLGLIFGLGRSPGVKKGYPLQYSGLEYSMDCRVLGVTNRWTRLSNFHFQLSRPSNLLPSPISKYFSQSCNRALKCDSVKW